MFYNMPGLEPVQDAYDNERGDQGDRAAVWTHVGYIASELCKYLHPLIGTGDVVDVYVQCIKY
jgi:hypothetical protein